MSKPPTSTAEILVHLVRSGAEAQDFHLAQGSTVADLPSWSDPRIPAIVIAKPLVD